MGFQSISFRFWLKLFLLGLSFLVMEACKKAAYKSTGEKSAVQSQDSQKLDDKADKKDVDAMDDLLKDKIAKEEEERKAEDKKIWDEIKKIWEKLKELEKRLVEEIKTREAEDNKLRKLIEEKNKLLADKINELEQADKDIAGLIEQLKNDTKAEIDQIKADLEKTNDQLAKEAKDRKDLEKALSERIEILEKSDQELKQKIIVQIKNEITVINEDLQNFKLYVEQNFATKEELKSLQLAVEALVQVTDLLDGKIDATKVELLDEITRVEQELINKIELVKADVDSIRIDLNKHIAEYNETVKNIYLTITNEINQIKNLVIQNQGVNQEKIDEINKAITELINKTASIELYAKNTRETLTKKIQELEAKDAELSEEIRDAKKEANENLQAAIAEEQELREKLSQKVAKLAEELDSIAALTQTALDLAAANASSIESLKGDLDTMRKDFEAQYEALTGYVDTKIEEVKEYALKLTQDLSLEVQKQFVEINARIGQLEQKDNSLNLTIINIFKEVLTDSMKKKLLEILPALLKDVKSELQDVRATIFDMEKEVITALDPVLKKSGVDTDKLNKEFGELAKLSDCGGVVGVADDFHLIKNREWFFHLAREYAFQLDSGIRQEDAQIDKIFFGFLPRKEQGILTKLLAAGALSPYATMTTGECLTQVRAWTRGILFGSGADSVAVRDVLTKSTELSKVVTHFYTKRSALNVAATRLIDEIVVAIKEKLSTSAQALEYLETPPSPSLPSPLAVMANIIIEATTDAAILAEVKVNRDIFIDMARYVATINNNGGQFEADLKALNDKVNELAGTIKDFGENLKTLKSSQIMAFNLIAAISARLGYDDLVQLAKEEVTKIGGTLSPALANMKATCLAAQHFYNHATNTKLPVARCESNLSMPGKELDYKARTRCAIHGGTRAYTWGNRAEVASTGWYTGGSMSGGHRVGNGLKINKYDPSDLKAIELAERSAGSVYPKDRESTFVLRIFGRAAKFAIKVTSIKSPNDGTTYELIGDKAIAAKKFEKGAGGGSIIYEIPIPKAIQRLGACRWDRQIEITALDFDGKPSGSKCVHKFHTFSPLVLNLKGSGIVKTINPMESKARFDMDYNGVREQIGWIGKDSGFLALDINGNGKIDNGAELFGESTLINAKQRARNGYQALGHHDRDKNGFIDRNDPIFDRLLVWIDYNRDGVSQVYELKKLAALQITKIGVNYQEVAKKDQVQNHGTIEANVVKYQSRYFGPSHCGLKGCASFDVFFGSHENYLLGAN